SLIHSVADSYVFAHCRMRLPQFRVAAIAPFPLWTMAAIVFVAGPVEAASLLVTCAPDAMSPVTPRMWSDGSVLVHAPCSG
ncbi:MAG: hypothetical protein KF861_11220, partial [Planctomycetaceae bacterium]|nr:hypothetical protein [Planctomycetaceae bacterium]